MNKLIKLTTAAAAASVACLSLQAATITGTVKYNSDGAPLSGAIVRVAGTANKVSTDDQGRFQLANVADGEVTIEASYYGIGEGLQTINTTSGTRVEILIGDNVVDLDPFLVVGSKTGQAKALNIQRS